MKFIFTQNVRYDLVVKNRGPMSNMTYIIQIEQVLPKKNIVQVFKSSTGVSIHIPEDEIISSRPAID
jgi:hypothetical protein